MKPCYFASLHTTGEDGTERCRDVDMDSYCFGCRQTICSNHNLNVALFGEHEPEDHLEG
jgi:hypothetical protein